MTDGPGRFLRRLAPMIYGPAVIFAMGMGAIAPMIPMIAAELGADLGLAGLITSMMVVGQLLGNVPGSWLVSRAGERVAMLIASGTALVGAIGVLLAEHLLLLSASVLLFGMSSAVFALGRHAFMTSRVPIRFRARALSLLGGSFRAGVFLGPFAAAAILRPTGDVRLPVWVTIGGLVLVACLVGFGPDPERVAPPRPITEGIQIFEGGVRDALLQNLAPLSRVGAAAAALAGTRAARDLILPLWGVSLGLEAHVIALVVGISGAIDFALFYLGGQAMDRFGRRWAAVPSMAIMAIGFLILSLTHDLMAASAWFVACGILLGIGNGLSSGVLMTLGADLAPRGDPAPFLATWRTLTDFGGAVLPLAISAVAVLSLPIASAGVGVVAILGAAGFARWIPRFIKT